MELEELKNIWHSVKPDIKSLGYSQKDDAGIARKNDVKSRLLRKVFLGELFSLVCIILLATSHLWSPTKLPVLWLASFCAVITVGIVCGIRLYLSIRQVNLWTDSNSKIFMSIVEIKTLYRRIELTISILIAPLLIWLSLTPPFLNTLDMYLVWVLTIICFGLEYLWYRSNIKQLNNLINWEQE
jgi:hypothetical protein